MAIITLSDITLGPGGNSGWYFQRTDAAGFLPYFSIQPLNGPEFAAEWFLTTGGYPYVNVLGISTQWCSHLAAVGDFQRPN